MSRIYPKPTISPLFIERLLHIYALAEPFNRPSMASDDVIAEMLEFDLIESCERVPGYAVTARGIAMVKLLRSTPLPRPAFIDPRTDEEVK